MSQISYLIRYTFTGRPFSEGVAGRCSKYFGAPVVDGVDLFLQVDDDEIMMLLFVVCR